MLFLTRKVGESIMINDDVSITVIQVSGRTVKLGINYPKHIRVFRQEIYDRIRQENLLVMPQSPDSQGDLDDSDHHPAEEVA